MKGFATCGRPVFFWTWHLELETSRSGHRRWIEELMKEVVFHRPFVLSVVVPCYNEQKTLETCIHRVLEIQDDMLSLEIIIVDDCSTDRSLEVALALAQRHPEIRVLHHEKNQGKGGALRTGFRHATGDFVAIQDADLEYNPMELRNLLVPLVEGQADVVFGSRFLSCGTHRVLYFWHSMGNKFLTFLSNMFTDLNLTDMETCYKVFRREIIQSIEIEETRFGVEPEMVAKVAQMRPRIYEMGISYYGRTYEEGKKIGVRDGFRALYCIFHYNVPKAPAPIQFLIYLFIGGVAALFNLGAFLGLLSLGVTVDAAAASAYVAAAVVNYLLCIAILFRHKARWNTATEFLVYGLVVVVGGALDVLATKAFIAAGMAAWLSKSAASVLVLFFNFIGRKVFVFPESRPKAWKPQLDDMAVSAPLSSMALKDPVEKRSARHPSAANGVGGDGARAHSQKEVL